MAEFDAHFSKFDFSSHRRVIAAVSGGSDSTGLLVLLKEFLGGLPAEPEIVAVTVDHGLRAESALEAEKVKALCAQMNIPHVTKVWRGAKPLTGIQAGAREARYALLADAALEAGASLVLTGHTEDDQIETVFMRAARGEGPGLAGIAPATMAFNDHDFGGPLWFGRPLLAARRGDVRDALTRRGVNWIDDPSNVNPDFERAAVRQSLAHSGAELFEDIRARQSTRARDRAALSERAAAMIDAHAREIAPGLLLISEALSREPDGEAAAEALRILSALAGGSSKMMDVERAAGLMSRSASGEPFKATVSRALLDRRRQGLFIVRERRGLAEPQAGNYDNRFVIAQIFRTPANEASFVFPGIETVNTSGAPDSLWRQARALTPEVSGGAPMRRLLNPWPLRVPLFDLPAASALARLTGTTPFPLPPCSL